MRARDDREPSHLAHWSDQYTRCSPADKGILNCSSCSEKQHVSLCPVNITNIFNFHGQEVFCITRLLGFRLTLRY